MIYENWKEETFCNLYATSGRVDTATIAEAVDLSSNTRLKAIKIGIHSFPA